MPLTTSMPRQCFQAIALALQPDKNLDKNEDFAKLVCVMPDRAAGWGRGATGLFRSSTPESEPRV